MMDDSNANPQRANGVCHGDGRPNNFSYYIASFLSGGQLFQTFLERVGFNTLNAWVGLRYL